MRSIYVCYISWQLLQIIHHLARSSCNIIGINIVGGVRTRWLHTIIIVTTHISSSCA